MPNGGQAVGNGNGGDVASQFLQCLGDCLFGFSVESAGCLV